MEWRKESKETPIAKYLANLERRKSMFGQVGSPSPTRNLPFTSTLRGLQTAGTQMKINFDDTFFSRNENESILHLSPGPSSISVAHNKKRRLSLYAEENENIEALQKKISDLERLLRQTQSELVDGQAACTKLDQINTETRRSYDEKVIALEKSQDEMKLKCKNATERSSSLEKQLLKLQRKDSDFARDSQTQITVQLNKISSLEATIAELQNKNHQFSAKLTEQSITEEQRIARLDQELAQAQKAASRSQQETEIVQGQLIELSQKYEGLQGELVEVKESALQSDELRKRLQATRAADERSTEELKFELNKMENLFVKEQLKNLNLTKDFDKIRQENDILKSTVQREHLLKEQVLSAESQISVLKEQVRAAGDLEGDRNNLRTQIKNWVGVATKLEPTCRTPLEFDSQFRKMQDLMLDLKLENTTLKHSIENCQDKVTLLESEVKLGQQQISTLVKDKERMSLDSRKIMRRMNLIGQDRDSLRGLMESYEKDFYEGTTLQLNPQHLRITQLEKLVAEYEATLGEDWAQRKCDDCETHRSSIQSLETDLQASQARNETLSRTLAEVDSTVVEQDGTTGLKIVSFGHNPTMLSLEARLKECIVENEELKKKLKEKEDETVVVNSSDEQLLKEKNELEDHLRSLQRRHEILTESYDYETVQLSNACTKLFGYFVTLNRAGVENPNQFRLQSVLSMGPEETFIFQEGTAGEMLLLDTPILAHFQDDIERFLQQESSVPGFLSAVTIAYTQGIVQFPSTTSMSLETVEAAVYEDDVSSEAGGMEILATESIHGHQSAFPRRQEVNVVNDVDDEDEDVGDEIESREGEDSDEEIYEDEEFVEDVDENYVEREDDDNNSDDDVVTLD